MTSCSTSAPTHERTRRPATIEQLASAPLIFYDAESADNDPIRRLLTERAQAHGLRLRPRVEVEMAEIALALVARGIGDTYLPVSYTHAPYYPAGLTTAPFTPALYNTFAIVTRPAARLAPGTRELLDRARDAHARPRGRIRPLAGSCMADTSAWTVFGAFRLEGKEAYDAEIENPAFTGSPSITITRLQVTERSRSLKT